MPFFAVLLVDVQRTFRLFQTNCSELSGDNYRNFADQNAMAHFLKNIASTSGVLQTVALGAGTFSIDSRLAESRHEQHKPWMGGVPMDTSAAHSYVLKSRRVTHCTIPPTSARSLSRLRLDLFEHQGALFTRPVHLRWRSLRFFNSPKARSALRQMDHIAGGIN